MHSGTAAQYVLGITDPMQARKNNISFNQYGRACATETTSAKDYIRMSIGAGENERDKNAIRCEMTADHIFKTQTEGETKHVPTYVTTNTEQFSKNSENYSRNNGLSKNTEREEIRKNLKNVHITYGKDKPSYITTNNQIYKTFSNTSGVEERNASKLNGKESQDIHFNIGGKEGDSVDQKEAGGGEWNSSNGKIMPDARSKSTNPRLNVIAKMAAAARAAEGLNNIQNDE